MQILKAPSSTSLAIALSDLAMMCLAIAVNLLPVFLTIVSRDLGGGAGLRQEQLGRIGAATFFGLVMGVLLTGPLADRLGSRMFAVGGNFFIAGGLLLLHLASNYVAVLVAAFVMGLGAGSLDMILSPIVAALQPKSRNVAMNLLHSFYCLGAVVTILTGTLAIRHGIGWRAISLGLTPLPLIIAISFCLVPLPPLLAAGTERLRLRPLLSERYFQIALLAIFLGGSTELGLAYWLPAYAEETLGFSKWIAGLSFVGFSLAMAIGRIGILFVPRRVNIIWMMIVCCAVSVVLFIIGSFSTSANLALAACIAVGLTGSCLWPSVLAIASDRYPAGGATMFALLAAMGNLGGIFMPWVVGMIADQSNLRFGLATAALCPVLMIVALRRMQSLVPRAHPANLTV